MKYFKIIQNTDSKIIGKYPQVKDLKINFHEARASQWGKIDEWKSDDDIPDLNNFLLQTKSKFTDLISNSFIIVSDGIFISERCKEIFEKFKVNGNFYNATIYKLDEKLSYCFLKYEYGGLSNIIWEKSEFIEYNINTLEFGNIVLVKNFKDYKEKVDSLRISKNDDMALWNLFPKLIRINKKYDMTPMFKYGLICNENVKNAIEENHLTGFLFEPLEIGISFE
ncbi:hypothetical protein [Flavobacterium sp. CAU 1735]|uniref:hypothetical protein n=1 Tax=Flavobacterium sp. CAU 1735 TaxID=3140361 RepID=UPI00325FE350